mmetsp:Transcript_74915/g.219467  ORF Transcript_74915/g.219467 Transcript_74915/m.219467 type:complete len:391 (+) Transcript_74915:591-1763(+)
MLAARDESEHVLDQVEGSRAQGVLFVEGLSVRILVEVDPVGGHLEVQDVPLLPGVARPDARHAEGGISIDALVQDHILGVDLPAVEDAELSVRPHRLSPVREDAVKEPLGHDALPQLHLLVIGEELIRDQDFPQRHTHEQHGKDTSVVLVGLVAARPRRVRRVLVRLRGALAQVQARAQPSPRRGKVQRHVLRGYLQGGASVRTMEEVRLSAGAVQRREAPRRGLHRRRRVRRLSAGPGRALPGAAELAAPRHVVGPLARVLDPKNLADSIRSRQPWVTPRATARAPPSNPPRVPARRSARARPISRGHRGVGGVHERLEGLDLLHGQEDRVLEGHLAAAVGPVWRVALLLSPLAALTALADPLRSSARHLELANLLPASNPQPHRPMLR